MLNNYIVANYVKDFINSIIEEKIDIKYRNNEYIIYLKEKNICIFQAFNFWNKSNKELYKAFNIKNLKFANDIIGTIFFFLSGYWEYINDFPKDKDGRVSAKQSFQYKYNLLEIPIVDILLKDFILNNNLHYIQKNARYFLTHDIDKLYYKITIKNLLGDIIKRKDFAYFLKNLKTFCLKSNPFSVQKLLNLNSKYGIVSNYYFLLGEPNKNLGYELQENIREINKIKKILKEKKQNIGLHYNFNYLNKEELIKRKKELMVFFELEIVTGRAHYLNFDIKRSFKICEQAGIKLDCTGGYHDAIGFRFGTSFPFAPFNFEETKSYNLIEVPLVFMDCTPFYYMNLDIKAGEERIEKLLNQIINTNGVISILWHNSSFYTKEWEKKEIIYKNILRKISFFEPYVFKIK